MKEIKRPWISLLMLSLAVTLVACSGGESEPTLPPGASPPETTAAPEMTTASKACEPPKFAPTYLPWEKSGSIPKPEKLKNGKDIILVWFGPKAGSPSAPQLDLARTVENQATGEGAKIPVRGTKGELTWNPEFKEMALRWTERDEPCGYYGLFFSDQKLSDKQALDEMLRIKKSLK